MKHLMIFCTLSLLLLISNKVSAGVSNHSRNTSLTLFTESPHFNFTTKSNITMGEEIIHQPNTGSVDGVQISFGDKFSISASSKRTPKPEEVDMFGDTKYQDFRFQFMHQSLFINSYYQSYHGFYISNSDKLDPSLTKNDPRMLNTGLNAQISGLNVFYIFEPNEYSLPAALYQSAKQTSSGGSLILGASISDFVFNTDTPLIPSNQQALYGSDSELNKGHFSTINGALGYGYTLVFLEKCFLSGVLLLGSGQEIVSFSTPTNNFKKTSKSIKSDNVITLGFNGELMFFGLSLASDGTNHYTNSLTLNTSLSVFNLHFGIRF